MRTSRDWMYPTALAAILTLLNAAKPAVVDDTAYLLTAKHIAANPTDPYGFDLFWYDRPYPAWKVLMPPVVPCWLGLGVRAVGSDPIALKLWLFPFALLLSHSVAFLLRRFARGWERPMLAVAVLGPAVLPLFNAMLDVPALALGLTATACFIRGCDGGRPGWIVAAGVAAGLAAQTKYTALTVPAVLAWYGLLHRRIGPAVAAIGIAGLVFAAWEALFIAKYGESHFYYHLRDQGDFATRGADADDTFTAKLRSLLHGKSRLFQPMLGYLGWLGIGVGMIAGAAVGVPRLLLAAFALAAAAAAAVVCAISPDDAVLVPRKLTLPTAVFVTLGSASGIAVLLATARLMVRCRVRRWIRWNRDSWFLAGWSVVELAGYFALTPFPAGRRVMALVVVGGLIAARLASRVGRTPSRRRVPAWVPVYGVAAGFALFALDFWDALPEKVFAHRAAIASKVGSPGTVWFTGHWGFQYYCDQLGMKPVVPRMPRRPGRPADALATMLHAGDRLVFPVLPDADGFYRPYHGEADFPLDPSAVELLEEFVWDDRLRAQTIPNLYGGAVPVTERAHPRLRVRVYRVLRDWTPQQVR